MKTPFTREDAEQVKSWGMYEGIPVEIIQKFGFHEGGQLVSPSREKCEIEMLRQAMDGRSLSVSPVAEAWLLSACKQAYELLPKWKAAGLVTVSEDGACFNFHRVKQNAIGERLFKLGFQSWTDAEKYIHVEGRGAKEKSLRAYADPQKPAKTYWEFEAAEAI